MQWLQNTNQSSLDNQNNIRYEASRHYRNKKKEYLKAKIDDLEPQSKIKISRDFAWVHQWFKKGYQSRSNKVKDEKGVFVTDCHSILARRRNHFSPLLNIHGVSDIRPTEIHTAEPLAPEPSAFEFKMVTEKLKRHKLPGIDQIPAEFVKSGARTIRSEIHKLIISIWNKRNCLRSVISLSFYLYFLFITRTIKQNVLIIEAYHFCQLWTRCYPTSCCEGQPLMQKKFLGIISVDFDATIQLLIIYSVFIKYLRKMGI